MNEQNNLMKNKTIINKFFYYIRSKVTMIEANYESTFYVYLLEVSLNNSIKSMTEYRLIHVDYLDETDIPLEYKSLLDIEDGYSEIQLDLVKFKDLLDETITSNEQYILFNADKEKGNGNIYHIEN